MRKITKRMASLDLGNYEFVCSHAEKCDLAF